MSLLVICEPLGLFVYTLTADDKYFVRNSENFLHSKKCNNLKSKNLFVNILLHFRNLHHDSFLKSWKKRWPSELMYLKKFQSVKYVVRPIPEKRRSKTPFHSQRVKGPQTFVKSACQHFYHIFWSVWEKLTSERSFLVICKIL